MSKHTREQLTKQHQGSDEARYVIGREPGNRFICLMDIDATDAEWALIAAAPELLEALKEARNVIRHAAQESAGRVHRELVGGWIHHANLLDDVIAKATGETLHDN